MALFFFLNNNNNNLEDHCWSPLLFFRASIVDGSDPQEKKSLLMWEAPL